MNNFPNSTNPGPAGTDDYNDADRVAFMAGPRHSFGLEPAHDPAANQPPVNHPPVGSSPKNISPVNSLHSSSSLENYASSGDESTRPASVFDRPIGAQPAIQGALPASEDDIFVAAHEDSYGFPNWDIDPMLLEDQNALDGLRLFGDDQNEVHDPEMIGHQPEVDDEMQLEPQSEPNVRMQMEGKRRLNDQMIRAAYNSTQPFQPIEQVQPAENALDLAGPFTRSQIEHFSSPYEAWRMGSQLAPEQVPMWANNRSRTQIFVAKYGSLILPGLHWPLYEKGLRDLHAPFVYHPEHLWKARILQDNLVKEFFGRPFEYQNSLGARHAVQKIIGTSIGPRGEDILVTALMDCLVFPIGRGPEGPGNIFPMCQPSQDPPAPIPHEVNIASRPPTMKHAAAKKTHDAACKRSKRGGWDDARDFWINSIFEEQTRRMVYELYCLPEPGFINLLDPQTGVERLYPREHVLFN